MKERKNKEGACKKMEIKIIIVGLAIVLLRVKISFWDAMNI